MSEFLPAVTLLLPREGGYNDLVNDHPTNYGISLKFYKSIKPDATKEDIKALTANQAIAIYKEHFWDNTNFDKIRDQKLTNAVFDMAVNGGIAQSVKLLQRAANQLRNELKIDGVFGKITLRVVNELNAPALLLMFRQERADFYKALVYTQPRKQMFLKGWLARAASA